MARRRSMPQDATGASADTALGPGEFLWDKIREAVRVGNGALLGGILLASMADLGPVMDDAQAALLNSSTAIGRADAAKTASDEATAIANAAALGRMASRTVSRVASKGADYVCDGTNDEVQIRQAIADLGANGGVVFVRASFNPYRIAETIEVPSNVYIVGEVATRNASYGVLFKTASGANLDAIFTVTGAAGSLVRNIRFDNIAFDGNLTTQYCVKYINADYIKHFNCRFINATNSIFSGYNGTAAPAVSQIPGGIYFDSCNISARGGRGVRFEYQTQCWFSNCWFTTGSTTVAWISLKCSDKVKISNCEFNTATYCFEFEDVYTGGVFDYACQYNIAVGCVFAQQSDMWLDTRTHPSSIRFTIIGTTSGNVPYPTDLAGTGNIVILSNYVKLPMDGGSWQEPRRAGAYYEWYDAVGKLRTKLGRPTGPTEGTLVGSQS